jgi:hypothetical protein
VRAEKTGVPKKISVSKVLNLHLSIYKAMIDLILFFSYLPINTELQLEKYYISTILSIILIRASKLAIAITPCFIIIINFYLKFGTMAESFF